MEKAIARYLEEHAPLLMRQLRNSNTMLRHLVKSVDNSLNAFRPHDFTYTLNICSFGSFQVAYREGTSDEDVINHSFERDIFFSGVPEYEPQPGDVILDIGAHIGTFSLLAASKVPSGMVYAVEACKETHNLLRINIALNAVSNIQESHLALAGSRGRCILHYDEGNWGHSIMKRLSSKGEEVPSDTLAAFMGEKNITKCHFIKFNCEGAEFPILLNADSDCLGRIEKMLILYHCDLVEEYNLSMLLTHLRDSGFRTKIRNEWGQRGWIIAERHSSIQLG